MTVDAALRQIVADAVAAAVAPLVVEVRELRVVVARSSAKWVSRADAARELGVSVDTVDRRCLDGSLRSRRLGRTVRILLEPVATAAEIAKLASGARS